MMLPLDEIVQVVHETLEDVLGVDSEDIELDASLIEDLGAEFDDFEDIAARLEDQLQIAVPADVVFPDDLPPEEITVETVVDGVTQRMR